MQKTLDVAEPRVSEIATGRRVEPGRAERFTSTTWLSAVAGCAYGLALLATAVAAAELTARIEDRLRLEIPLLATPSYEDLLQQEPFGMRGRDNGRFGKWKLNRFGFRSPQISLLPAAHCRRVLVLGASESFGLYESAGKEYPAQLASKLEGKGCYEVVNAAVAGLNVHRIGALWANWASQFKPETVIVYPSPAFYLGNIAPSKASLTRQAPLPVRSKWTLRLMDRAKDRINYPAFWQERRVAGWLTEARAGRPASWFFEEVPQDRLKEFSSDLDALVVAIRASGAQVVLVTHATGFQTPPREDELPALDSWNTGMPRASRMIILQFEQAAAQVVRELASRRGAILVDAAVHMSGHRSWFAPDLIHFTDEGAGVMATLIAERLAPRDGDPGARNRTAERVDALQ